MINFKLNKNDKEAIVFMLASITFIQFIIIGIIFITDISTPVQLRMLITMSISALAAYLATKIKT